jgi:oxygen-dependent protoporphyrinogen oxidase
VKVVVVGGGVSGLAAAHRVLELDPSASVTVLERSNVLGGGLRTERANGYVIEVGPDSIITDKPWALDLIRRVGLGDRMIGTIPQNRGAYVVCRGRLERIPEGFSMMAPLEVASFLRSPILSWPAKSRAGLELVLPRGHDPDESLRSFVTRRFGKELFERLAQPLVGGIYGADPARLSLRATMPRFVDMEQEARSVAMGLGSKQRAAKKQGGGDSASGARYGLFVNFEGGSQTLIDALVGALARAKLETSADVTRLERSGEGFRVVTAGGAIDADAVIVALPAWAAAPLLRPHDDELAGLLGGIAYGSSATVTMAFERDAIEHPLDAYGYVTPTVERRTALASTWASRKWKGRAPEGMELIRVFLGGYSRPEVARWPTEDLVRAARREVRELVGARGEPALVRVQRYLDAMPQYEVGHRALVRRIEARVAGLPNLALAGNAYRGVGVPDAIHQGERAAEAIVEARG